MKLPSIAAVASLLLIGPATFRSVGAAELAPQTFRSASANTKVHTWWHWISGNITKGGITKDLESMKQQGVSQATILNVGGHVGTRLDLPEIKFDSPEWYGMFRHALAEAKRLGITIGVHNCDGWSTSGGPWVTPEWSMKEYVWSKTTLTGAKQISVHLDQPPMVAGYYRDVAVLAYPNVRPTNSYMKADPTVKIDRSSINNSLSDGNPLTKASIQEGSAITVSFDAPFETDQLVILPHLVFAWDNMSRIPLSFTLSSSMDGKTFSEIKRIELVGANILHRVAFTRTKAKFFKLKSLENKNRCEIAEFELLKRNEAASFATGLDGLLQKSVAVKVDNEKLYQPSKPGKQQRLRADQVIDITSSMSINGTLNWTAPEGDWSVLRFGYTTTGMKNKPATPEGEGLEIDKMDAGAAKIHFDAFTGKLLDEAGDMAGSTFKFILIDSWECHYQNWTHAFPQEFNSRRGYDLTCWIPVLCGEVVESEELSDAFLHDFRKTIADLIDQNYYRAVKDLCHQNKLEMHAEAIYGGGTYPPLDILKSNGHADLPMLEFWARHDKDTKLQNYSGQSKPDETFPSYSSLACNKPIIGSEAYTSRAYYTESPATLKRHGDAAFCAGVNQMILHSYVHQPIAKKPGVTLGQFGAHFNRNNPWYNHASDWMTYQARAQYMLQKGEPVVDCVFYVGDELPQPRKYAIRKDLPFGYRTNACNFDMLNDQATVIDGKLSFGGAQQFALLVLPTGDSIELKTLKVIESLVRQGAVIFGPRPTRLLGAVELRKNKAEFKQRVNALWGEEDAEVVDRMVDQGRVIWGKRVGDVLAMDLGVKPDLTSTSASPTEIMYIHKRTPDEDIYFVFNQTEKVLDTELLFRVTGKQPEIWQAETGAVKDQPIYATDEHQTRIPMTFAPSESFFVVFRSANEKPHVTKITKDNKTLFPQDDRVKQSVPQATYAGEDISMQSDVGGSYTLTLSEGSTIQQQLVKPTVIDIGIGNIEVAFEPIYDAKIAPITMTSLESITQHDDPAIKYFAGTLKYKIAFSIPVSKLENAESVELNFGKFDAAGLATLNGKSLGKIWNHGTRVGIADLLNEHNVLEVELATTCRNRMLGDLKEFGEIKTIWTTSPTVKNKMLDPSMPLKPSGLMGPLTLTIR